MIKAALNASAPLMAVAGGDLYGIPSSTLGTALLVIMALAVIVNQLWTLAEKWRAAVRNPEASTAGLTMETSCGLRRRDIGRTLDQLRAEDLRQDALNKDRFDDIDKTLKSIRQEMRQDNKEVNKSLEKMTLAVGELIGKASK